MKGPAIQVLGRFRREYVLLILLLVVPGGISAAAESWVGRPLVDVLSELREEGLEIFFTSQLVPTEMKVIEAPRARETRRKLEELLEPHGLAVVEGPGGRLVVVEAEPRPSGIHGQVRARQTQVPIPGVQILVAGTSISSVSDLAGEFEWPDLAPGFYRLEARLPGFVVEHLEVEVKPRRRTEVVIDLDPAPIALDEIIITPSRISLLREDPTVALNLDREEIFSLPHLGDDIFRALTLMPGVTGQDTSARFHVRGGRADEVLVLLDKVELFEPYHLKDYSSSLSIITPRALKEVNLITGGFPAEYGDRMSGVLEMNTERGTERTTHIGLSVLTAELGSSGHFADRKGHGLTSLRRGQLDLALDLLGQQQKPKYWDGFGKFEYQLGPSQQSALHLLHSEDTLNFLGIDPDNIEDYDTSYENSYAWLSHQWILTPRLFVDTVASIGTIRRDRRADELEVVTEDEDEESDEDAVDDAEVEPQFQQDFILLDRRELDVTGIKQEWNGQLGEQHYLKWGFDLRRLETVYDYFNERHGEDLLAGTRFEPQMGITEFRGQLSGRQHSAYLSDRIQPKQGLNLEIGLRYDEHTLTSDQHLSPRLNLAFALGESSTLRAAWGYFYQSQRPYELQVEDGVTELAAAERTEQWVLGFEHHFAKGRDGLLRLEAYQREIRDPRSRYDNLFQPVEIFPEIEPDRVLLQPQQGRGWGIELFLRSKLGKRVDGWLSYVYSKTEDQIEGTWIPRRFDQPHAINLDINIRAGEDWNLNLAWRFHTGWPTTAVSARLEEDEEGELEAVPVIGPFYRERFSDYHRLDVRASREWQMRKGKLGFFLEIQNLYDRKNPAGFDPEFEYQIDSQGAVEVLVEEEVWTRFLPSFGVTWDF